VTRYPTPGMVSITSGSPSLRRSRPIVTWTVFVKGSVCSSQRWLPRSIRRCGRLPWSRVTVDIFLLRNIFGGVARAPATADVFNAIGEARRREILDALVGGEKAVGTIVDVLSMSQPQVSKHLRVLSAVGLVRCRAEGRRRLYRLDPAHLRPLHDWMAKYEQIINERLDRMDDYLKQLQRQGEPQ
jgi:DNA-binding transcriptional ArsR family regulator